MPVKTLDTRVRYKDGVAIIDLSGEINSFAVQALNDAYAQASATAPQAILLNFNDVDYINSTGIALIVGVMSMARKSNARMAAFGLSDHYVEIFEITRLADFMGIYPDEDSALEEMI